MSFKSSRSANSSSSASRKRGRATSSSGNRQPAAASWGANSPSSSSSRSSARKSPFSDFGSYMAEKNRKLQDQFDAEASGAGGGKGIFHGVSIFVDGFTVPSSQDLREYMLKHGGRMENYFSKQRVTHIVCSNLPDSKMRNLRSFSRGLPVVKPKWVLDSVAANKLLSWVPYQLDQFVSETHKQQKLSAFFGLKSISGIKNAENWDPMLGVSFPNKEEPAVIEADDQHSKSENECSESSFNPGRGSILEGQGDTPNITEDESSSVQQLLASPFNNLENADVIYTNEKSASEPVHRRSPRGSKQHHSTLSDPNFVDNYFKNSRLHFIGTWRNRYRKRFLDKSNFPETKNYNTGIFTASEKSAVIHIDMDCFFVSVVVRNYPELVDNPVAVCHSDNPKGTAEISSANYPARGYGVHAGMFVRDAKALCPNLVIFPYDFEAYEEVADQFYTILHKYSPKVQAVSCDEAFLDVTSVHEDPEKIASIIRHEIALMTRCTASAGIAETMLLARLATRSAKPNGQCCIPSEKVEEYLKDLPLKALPGIGYVLEEKLRKHHIQTCGQLRLIPKDTLQKDFGSKTGDMLWKYSRGIDNRLLKLEQETKSVGAEVNWGVRFNDMNDCQHFLMNLCKEVSLRLQGCGMRGRTVTLKVKKRREGAEEPTKYMGCGECINMSRSSTVPTVTDSAELLQRISKQLFGSLQVDVKEVRGIGLQISRLEHADLAKIGRGENTLESWLSPISKETGNLPHDVICQLKDDNRDALISDRKGVQNSREGGNQHIDDISAKCCIYETGSSIASVSTLKDGGGKIMNPGMPPIHHLDMDVIKSLPPEITAEINDMYNGRLSDFFKDPTENGKVNDLNKPSSSGTNKEVELESINDLNDKHMSSGSVGLYAQDKGKRPLVYDAYAECRIEEEMTTTVLDTISETSTSRADLIPSSLSQVDISVLQQLPEDLKADILETLPAHSKSECSDDTLIRSAKGDIFTVGKETAQYSLVNLWEGDPPRWVHTFQTSNCMVLNIFAEACAENEKTNNFSSILQSLISSLPSLHINEEEWDEAFSGFVELFTQYIKFKIESDIEEVYVCFQLLRRFALQSAFFSYVHDKLLPSLQASVSENYGGTLKHFTTTQ